MSLRLKIVAALVLLAACATAAVGVSSYVSTRHELNQVVDRSLTSAATSPGQVLRSSAVVLGSGRSRALIRTATVTTVVRTPRRRGHSTRCSPN